MEAVYVALITTFGAVLVALVESGRRKNNSRWDENKQDHNFVVDKIDSLGKSLGISIDRVEKGVERTEKKIDQHIRDHAKGDM
jgi:ribosome assembly protein YihI (activator of Der GTPase)